MKAVSRIISCIPIIVLVLILLGRFHIAMVRFFDPDEFANMHWSWLIAGGLVPYRDFFYYNLMFYQWLLVPIFWLPNSHVLAYLSRFWHYIIYIFSLILLYRISYRFSGQKITAIMAVLIMAAFPMTFDKTIDIRADMPMIVFLLLTIELLIQKRPLSSWKYLTAGITMSLSILMLQKIVYGLPAVIYLFLLSKPKPLIHKLLLITLGGLIPAGIFIGYLSIHGALIKGINAITIDTITVNAGKLPFSPWKALSPYPLVYVAQAGISFPWILNSVIWIMSLIGAVIFFIKRPDRMLFILLFFIAGWIFVFLFANPYLQYFMPFSVFVSFLAAYVLWPLSQLIFKLLHIPSAIILNTLSVILSMCLLYSFFLQYRQRVADSANNAEQVQVLKDITEISTPADTAYDMVGSYIFLRDGYIICCHPYAEFVDKLNRPYPTLRESLLKNQTKFLILDRTGMSLWQPKPDDLNFLVTHYLPSEYKKIYIPGMSLACNNGVCSQLNIHGQATDIVNNTVEPVVAGEYSLTIDPPSSTIWLNGIPHSQSTLKLDNRLYAFTVDPQTRMFSVRLKLP